MKYLYAILTSFLFVLPTIAGKHNLNVVYQSDYKYISILDYTTSDTATVINMRCSLTPGENYVLKKRMLYLDDEKCRKYRLKQTQGLIQGDTVRCPYSGFVDFSLVFEPLNRDVRIFDLRSTNEYYPSFAFWGIHKEGVKGIKHVKDSEICLTRQDIRMVDGTSLVKGTISNYGALNRCDTFQICMREPTNNPTDGYILRYYESIVAEDGRFEFKVPIEHMNWVYLRGKEMAIPIVLCPDDELTVSIENFGEIDMKVSYRSKDGNAVMQNLLRAAANYTAWDFVYRRYDVISPTLLNNKLEQEKTMFEKFSDYLAWKYKLSSKEVHLLRLNYNSLLYEVAMVCLNRVFDVSFKPGTNIEAVREAMMSSEVIEAHTFMKAINTDDYSYLILPSQYLLLHLHNAIPLYSSKMTKDMYIEIIEKYIDRQLNEDWKKRINI